MLSYNIKIDDVMTGCMITTYLNHMTHLYMTHVCQVDNRTFCDMPFGDDFTHDSYSRVFMVEYAFVCEGGWVGVCGRV